MSKESTRKMVTVTLTSIGGSRGQSFASLRQLGLLLPIAILCGCRVGPAYKPPAIALAPYHNTPDIVASASTAPAPALDHWWLGFQDATLTDLVERALAQNLDLAASYARVEQARAMVRSTAANRKPNVGLVADDSAIRQSLESPFGRYADLFPEFHRNQNYFDLGVMSTWEVDIFGELRHAAAASRDEEQAAEAQRLGVRISIAAETADAYLQIRGVQRRLAFAREQISTDEHLVQLVSQKRSAGVASDRELAQAEALVSQAKASVFPLQVILESQLNRLDVLLGVQPGTNAGRLKEPAEVPQVPSIASSLDAGSLLRRRPDLIAAERKLAASNERIGQAIAGYYPSLSLTALLGNQAINPAGLFKEAGFQPTAVAGIRWRLFDFGRVDAEVRQAKGVNAESLAAYRSAVLRATEEVEDSLNALAESEQRGNEVSVEITALQRVRDRSNEAYQAGVIALTDVLDADRQLLIARDELAQSQEDATRAAVSSFRALGGGWTP